MRLPETWIQTNLGVVLRRVTDKVDTQTGLRAHITFVGLEDIESNTGRLLKSQGDDLKDPIDILSAKTPFAANDILYGRLRPYLNKVHLAQREGICSTEIWVLRPADEVNPEFAAHYLRSPAVCQQASQLATGANLPRVPDDAFDRIPIPLPTLREQDHIVEMLRQAEELTRLRQTQTKQCVQLSRERFFELFGHPAENPYGFEMVSLAELGAFDRGVSKYRPRDAAHLFNGPYPFIQTGDVSNAGDWITKYNTTYSEAGLAQSRLWPRGTLCITIAANIARAAILDFDACFPDSIVGFTPHENVHTEYVLYCIRFYQEFFEQRASKSAQMNINLEKLRELRVPKPPEPLQRDFANFVKAGRVVADDMATVEQNLAVLSRELQSAAFSGELTEEWRRRHRDELERADIERRAALGAGLKSVSTKFSETAPPERAAELRRPGRVWLIDQLSKFQCNVRLALYEWKGTVVPDDTEAFDDFCRVWPMEDEVNGKDRVRRVLEELAALGLIAKIALPNAAGRFVTGFRSLREEENIRLADAQRLQSRLEPTPPTITATET